MSCLIYYTTLVDCRMSAIKNTKKKNRISQIIQQEMRVVRVTDIYIDS